MFPSLDIAEGQHACNVYREREREREREKERGGRHVIL